MSTYELCGVKYIDLVALVSFAPFSGRNGKQNVGRLQGKCQLLPPAPSCYPLHRGNIHTRVIYGVLLRAGMNAATPLGARVCSVMFLGVVSIAPVGSRNLISLNNISNIIRHFMRKHIIITGNVGALCNVPCKGVHAASYLARACMPLPILQGRACRFLSCKGVHAASLVPRYFLFYYHISVYMR